MYLIIPPLEICFGATKQNDLDSLTETSALS